VWVEMGKITIVLPDDLEERFRYAAFKKFKPKKGSLSDAGEEAILMWLKENE